MHRINLTQQSTIDDMNSKLDRLVSLVQASWVGTAVERSRLYDAPRASSTSEEVSLKALPQSHDIDAKRGNKVEITSGGSDQRRHSSGGMGKVQPELVEDELGGESELWDIRNNAGVVEALDKIPPGHSHYAYDLTAETSVPDNESPSHATLLAANMVRDLRQLKIPTPFYFIHRPKQASLDRESCRKGQITTCGPADSFRDDPQLGSSSQPFRAPSRLPPSAVILRGGRVPASRERIKLYGAESSFQAFRGLHLQSSNAPAHRPAVNIQSLWAMDGFCRDLQQARKSQGLAHVGFEDDEDFESMAGSS
ncbi:hypothetical protein CSAL01_02739 [Colletotrichum salicis]|uniref:Uncharacterized protein n=1 Tax=Colletotrichum salicis TaxID=1209931 RepID=A0A135V7B4_9PEZI|nr:hypothetical protein CSAL01_02739 [Colletotrichum salicis]